MHPEEIKRAIRSKGQTLVAFAKELEVRVEVLHNVIAGRGRSKRIEAAISSKIGQPLHLVFPTRYAPPTPTAPVTIDSRDLDKVRSAMIEAIGIIDYIKASPAA